MRILIVDPHPVFSDGLETNLKKAGCRCERLPSLKDSHSVSPDDFDLCIIDPAAVNFNHSSEIDQIKRFSGKLILCAPTGFFEIVSLARRYGGPAGNRVNKTLKTDLNDASCPLSVKAPGFDGFQSVSRKLTSRQKEVLSFLCTGCSNKMIAYHMSVSEATVKLHVNALLRNLNVSNRTQAVLAAYQTGLVKPGL